MATATKKPWNAKGAEKSASVRDMFAQVAKRYDFMNSAMSLRLHYRWREFAVRLMDLQEGNAVLDVCCGTGDFGKPIRKRIGEKGRLYGIDFCRPMLEIAKTKPYKFHLTLGDAMHLPFQDECFSGVTVGWGLRNVADLPQTLKQIYRVLRNGGKFVSVDTAIPKNKVYRIFGGVIFNTVVPFLGFLSGNKHAYTYLTKSTEKFATREQLASEFRKAGFRNVRWHDLFFGYICVMEGEK